MFSELKFPQEIAKDIALQEKKRKNRKLTQAELSKRAGISLASLKRIEQTGEISFVSLIKIADILDEKEVFAELFATKECRFIQEVIDERQTLGPSQNYTPVPLTLVTPYYVKLEESRYFWESGLQRRSLLPKDRRVYQMPLLRFSRWDDIEAAVSKGTNLTK